MAIKHDSQGFLIGEPIDLGGATGELQAIKGDISAIRKSIDEFLSHATSAGKTRAEEPPQTVIRRTSTAADRDDDFPTPVSPGRRSSLGRGQERPEVAAFLSKLAKQGKGPAVVPSRTRSAESATVASENAGAPRDASKIVRELKETRRAMQKVVTPSRRDVRGRFASTSTESGSGTAGHDNEAALRTTTGHVAGRIAGAVRDALHGADHVDPSIKAFQEVAGPLSRGYELLGGGKGDRQERWYRRIFGTLTGLRKDESVANKKIDKRLKAIEEKPIGEEGGGFFGLLLTLLAGLGALLKKIPVLGPLLAGIPKLLKWLPAAMLPPALRPRGKPVVTAAAPGAKPAPKAPGTPAAPGAKPSLWQRTKSWLLGGKGAAAEEAGVAAKAGRLAKFGRFAGAAAKRIPILGSLVGLGLGAFGSSAIEGDAGTTRQQKNEAQGRNWGGVGGGLAGAVAGQALIPIPVVGAVIGAVVGEWLGSNAGEIIGAKWSDFIATLQPGWEVVRDAGLATWDWIKGGWDGFVGLASQKFEAASKTLTDVFASVSAAVQQRWHEVADAAKKLMDYARTIPGVAAAMDAVEAGRQKAINATTDVIEATANHVEKMRDGGQLLAQDAGNFIADRAEKTWEGAKLLGSDIADAAKNLIPQGLKDNYQKRRAATAIEHATEARQAAVAKSKPSARMAERFSDARGHLQAASDRANVDPGIVAKIAHFESGFNSEAKAPTSTAHGYGQFINGTWAKTVRQHGEKYGIKGAATLSDAQTLKYRGDKDIQAAMLAEFTKQNIALGRKYGGASDDANVYALHNLGEGDGKNFLQSMKMNPQASVNSVLSAKVIKNNPSLYGDGTISLADAYGRMGQKMAEGQWAANQVSSIAQAKPDFTGVTGGIRSTASIASAKPMQSPAISLPTPPVTVSLTTPSLPSPPKVPAVEEPAQIPMPIASLDSKRPPIKVSLPWQDIGQDLRERGIAHIVTGGLSSSGVG